MTCDRCLELEAEIEALRDELHDLRVAEVRGLSTAQAETRRRHPSTRTDDCNPFGLRRPDLRLIGGET